MKRKLVAVIALLALGLLSATVAHAQATQAPPAGKQASAGRSVEGRTLISTVSPPIRIKFGKDFEYVGSQSFILHNSALVEQFFFLNAAQDKRIERVFMVQFESYLPTNTHTYDYKIKDTVALGGLDFMHDTAVVNVPAFRKQYPDSDAARAAAFLEGQGYRLAGEDIIYKRFVRLVDQMRRSELLIIYYENLNGGGLTAADLSEKGRAAGRRERIFQEVHQRALKSFKVLK